MIVDAFFKPDYITSYDFFREAEPVRPPRTVAINSSSIDTSAIDKYRQGVELTHIKHYDAGIVKIHAGEPGHRWADHRYGLGRGFRSEINEFEETNTFDAVAFIKDQEDGNIPSFSYPIVSRDYDGADNYENDGIIEPLIIRAKASFFSIDTPFEAHDIRAMLMSGNPTQNVSSDYIVSIDYRINNPRYVPFYDLIDMMGNIPTTAYFDQTLASFPAFEEKEMINDYPRDAYNNASDDVLTALQKMNSAIGTGSLRLDNYVRYNQVAAPTGWVFESNSVDSLAFGGLTQ